MEIDLTIILNVLLGIVIYKTIDKAIMANVYKWLLSSDVAKKQKASFQDKLKEKLNNK